MLGAFLGAAAGVALVMGTYGLFVGVYGLFLLGSNRMSVK